MTAHLHRVGLADMKNRRRSRLPPAVWLLLGILVALGHLDVGKDPDPMLALADRAPLCLPGVERKDVDAREDIGLRDTLEGKPFEDGRIVGHRLAVLGPIESFGPHYVGFGMLWGFHDFASFLMSTAPTGRLRGHPSLCPCGFRPVMSGPLSGRLRRRLPWRFGLVFHDLVLSGFVRNT